MRNYYECHITMEGEVSKIKPLVQSLKWKFSAIDGDILMGTGVKYYATYMFSALKYQQDCIDELLMVAHVIESHGIKVTRRKLKLVIYNDRVGTCDCSNCPSNN